MLLGSTVSSWIRSPKRKRPITSLGRTSARRFLILSSVVEGHRIATPCPLAPVRYVDGR